MRTAKTLSSDMQDAIARVMLAYAGFNDDVIALTAEEEADMIAAQAETAAGEFATESEV